MKRLCFEGLIPFCPDEIMGAIPAFGRLLRVLVLDVRLILVAEFSSQFIASDIKRCRRKVSMSECEMSRNLTSLLFEIIQVQGPTHPDNRSLPKSFPN